MALPQCSRCLKKKVQWPASYIFNVDANPGLTIVYMYLCAACHGCHSEVAQQRYRHI
jgi:hypothetical protein